MEKSWKITLSDGTKLENLRLNGNNFVSDTELFENDFKGKLTKVQIEGTTQEGQKIKEEYTHLELVQITHYEDGYYFVLRQITEAELDKIKTQADIEYIAMMTDVDLEEV